MGVAALSVLDGFFLEPKHPVVKRISIRLARLPQEFDGFRIAQISDIHFGPFMGKDGVQRALDLVRPFKPDFVALTGDFVSHSLGHRHGPAGAHHAEPCADALVNYQEAPLIAILGNHDHWNNAEIVASALQERGIRLLRNSAFPLERGGRRLWIAGVDDPLSSVANMDLTLRKVPAEEATILLAHEPDFVDYAARFPIDLQMSGHSHGGQVRVPGIGPLILPQMGRKYPQGLYQVGNLQLYTNIGLGVVEPPVRLNCPPEVTLITLQAVA